MSDGSEEFSGQESGDGGQAMPPTPPPAAAMAVERPTEDVLRGMAFGFLGVIGGVALTIVIWRVGFVASITSLVLAAGATFLYAKGAGAPPRRGIVPLVIMIVLGVVVAFFGVIASDAWVAYDDFRGMVGSQTRLNFVWDNMFRGEVIRSYGKDMAWFGAFAVLGIYGTLRRLIGQR